MIPLNYIPRKNILDDYYNLVIEARRKNKIDELDKWCKRYFVFGAGGTRRTYSFEDVVKASPEELVLLARRVRTLKKHHLEVAPYYISKNRKKKYYSVTTLYGDMHANTRGHILKALSIVTCPYCNRSYINSAESRSGCHLDHFYDKMSYPILAVSFFNLIPVCSTCNIIKGNKQLSYSPHDSRYKSDELLRFSYTYKSSPGGVRILIKPSASAHFYKRNVEVLELDALYQIHTDYVQEIIQKASYVSGYKTALYNSLGLTFSDEEIMRHFLGNYHTEEMYGRRPLAKLTHDIATETGIL